MVAAVVLVGCGGSEGSGNAPGAQWVAAEGRALAMGYSAAEAKVFAQDSLFCGRQPRSDLAEEFGLARDASAREVALWHAEGADTRYLKVVLAGCLDGLRGAPARPAPSSPLAEMLWGRTFAATSVAALPGEPEPPVRRPPHITITFSQERGQGVGWNVGCNSNGGKVRITATRLLVRGSGGTLVGCQEEVLEEEEWLWELMSAEPEWNIEGDELTLIGNGAEVTLIPSADPKGRE